MAGATTGTLEMIGEWMLRRLAWAGTLMLAAHGCASADATADFYRGKTISLYVGFPPGGGYDLYARWPRSASAAAAAA